MGMDLDKENKEKNLKKFGINENDRDKLGLSWAKLSPSWD